LGPLTRPGARTALLRGFGLRGRRLSRFGATYARGAVAPDLSRPHHGAGGSRRGRGPLVLRRGAGGRRNRRLRMSRGFRILAVAMSSLLAVLAVLFALAWTLIPRDWIERQALRQASRIQGATVRWKGMTPAFEGLAIGIKLEGRSVRIADTGEAEAQARA